MCASQAGRKTPQKHQTYAELLYHVIASEEGVDGVKVVVKELRHTVDDVKGDGLQNIHHLHVFPCGVTEKDG